MSRETPRRSAPLPSPSKTSASGAAASYHVRLAVAIAALAPKLRCASLLALTWSENIDADFRFISVRRHKTVTRVRLGPRADACRRRNIAEQIPTEASALVERAPARAESAATHQRTAGCLSCPLAAGRSAAGQNRHAASQAGPLINCNRVRWMRERTASTVNSHAPAISS
jgi:hypothetical protein